MYLQSYTPSQVNTGMGDHLYGTALVLSHISQLIWSAEIGDVLA